MSVINLNRYRKRKAREAERKEADANAARHGRSKQERLDVETRRRHLESLLDGSKLDVTAEPGPPSTAEGESDEGEPST